MRTVITTGIPEEPKINEEVLCVLRKNDSENQTYIDYVDILSPFEEITKNLVDLCDEFGDNIPEILALIEKTKEFDQLSSHYRYCVLLGDSYQAFDADNQDYLKKMNERYNKILLEKEKPNDNCSHPLAKRLNEIFLENVKAIKKEIKDVYLLWNKAYSMKKTYRLCFDDKSILTFSHRMDGWSNPVYQLTPNFSIEIKTNFGYGNSSYFYIKIKYKNIDITPFSEWVDYEFAKFSEIKRYTKSYALSNEFWLDVMNFAQDACSLSLTDEAAFLEKYVVDECEKMINGLEDLLINDNFCFEKRGGAKYSVDKVGHELIEFRSEKISGALDFISKIIEFDGVLVIKSFVLRIEKCSEIIEPIVVEEIEVLKNKIENLIKIKNELQPEYDEVINTKSNYNKKMNNLRIEINRSNNKNTNFIAISNDDLEKEFIKKHPEYSEFNERFKSIYDSYKKIIDKIQSKNKIKNNMISYNKKINKYFHDQMMIEGGKSNSSD